MRRLNDILNRKVSFASSSREESTPPARSVGDRAGSITPRIDELAHIVDRMIETRWIAVVLRHGRRLELLFQASPIRACAAYLRLLMQPLELRLQQMELLAYPRLPGTLAADREWRALEESHHERWFGVTVCSEADEPVGTLITILHCATRRFEITRRPTAMGINSVRFDEAVNLGRATLAGTPASRPEAEGRS